MTTVSNAADGPPQRAARRDVALRLLRELIAGQRAAVRVAFAGAALHLLTQLALPLVSRWALDDVVVAGDREDLSAVAAILVGLGVARAGGAAVRRYASARLMAGIGRELRSRLNERVHMLSASEFDRLGVGQVMTRMSSDVTLLENVAVLLPLVVETLAVGIVGAVVLFVLQPALAGLVVAVVAVVAAATLRRAGPLHATALAFQDAVGDFGQFAEQRVGGIRVIKGHGVEEEHAQAGERLACQIASHGVRHGRDRASFLAVFQLGPGAASVVVLGVGGAMAASGALTPGEVLAFLQYLTLFAAPVLIVAQLLALWPLTAAAASRIAEVLEMQPTVADPPVPVVLPRGPGAVSFRGVRFGYEPGHVVLDGLDLDVPGGTTLALVGRGASGKTTLIRLLGRFHDPWEGEVLLDGVRVSQLSLRDLRDAVSFAFEDSVVFSATIEENIALGRPGASRAEILAAARQAKVDDFVESLPGGYGTHVGQQGAELSGGQRQRLAVARALLRQSRVLVLDDPTSALDPDTDEAVRTGLLEAMRGCTAIVVAHRPETVALADRVAFLADGHVVAIGTHEELLGRRDYRVTLGLEPDDGDGGSRTVCYAGTQ